jgi:hypothetical protein
MADMLNDRGLMGEGLLDIPQINTGLTDAGFDGFIEVDFFQRGGGLKTRVIVLDKIVESYQQTL